MMDVRSALVLLTGRYAMRAGIHNTIGGASILHKNEKTIVDLLGAKGPFLGSGPSATPILPGV